MISIWTSAATFRHAFQAIHSPHRESCLLASPPAQHPASSPHQGFSAYTQVGPLHFTFTAIIRAHIISRYLDIQRVRLTMADETPTPQRGTFDSRPRPVPHRTSSGHTQTLRPGASPTPHRHSPSPSPSHHRQSFTDQLRGMPPSPRQVSSAIPAFSSDEDAFAFRRAEYWRKFERNSIA